MKPRIITQLLFSVLILVSNAFYGQTNNRFFASYEDFINNKFIEGYELVDLSWVSNFGGRESFKIKVGDKIERRKLSELPSELYTYDGWLNRTFDGDCHIVLYVGTICVYAWIGDNRGVYYSEGITGEMKRFSQKYLEKLLSEHGLLQQYKADVVKWERSDSPDSYYTKVVARNIKYIKLMEPKKENQ